VLQTRTFTGTQLPNSTLSGSTSGRSAFFYRKTGAAFMRFYGFLGCPRLVEPKLVRMFDRAVHPEGQLPGSPCSIRRGFSNSSCCTFSALPSLATIRTK